MGMRIQSTEIEVDGERFVVSRSPSGRYDVKWLSGPNKDYGFSMTPVGPDAAGRLEIEDHIRSFLTDIDPATGYLSD